MSAQQESPWGRVDDDRTVYVRTSEGERAVGQYPEGTPEEALKFFTDRFDALAFEVELLEKRVRAGALSPDEAAQSVKTVREQVVDAHAVGDLEGLAARLDSLGPVIASAREARKAERAQKVAESKERKEAIVAEAEKISGSNDWRNGANRLRDLLEEWKGLPRLDRSSDDALWRRFSSARTAYTRRRKAHFAEQHEKRDGARVIKERLATEAEALATSTEWGPTAGRYRDLMREWKAAGPAPRDVDEALWKRFRGAQDTFFGARDAANAELDQEYAANAEVKEALLVEAEALLPVTDVEAAKRAFRGHRRQVGRRWQGAARQDQAARGPDPQGGAGDPRGRGRAVAQVRPREVRPRRRHGRQAAVGDRRDQRQARQGSRRR